jgi:hypothetical protein
MVMGRERLDAQAAFERLRGAARSSTRRLADVAKDVTAGQPLPTNRRDLARDGPRRPRSARPAPKSRTDDRQASRPSSSLASRRGSTLAPAEAAARRAKRPPRFGI